MPYYQMMPNYQQFASNFGRKPDFIIDVRPYDASRRFSIHERSRNQRSSSHIGWFFDMAHKDADTP